MHILKGDVTLWSLEPQIAPFYSFMLADSAFRLPLLLNLGLNFHTLSVDGASSLNKLLRYLAAATYLRRLTLLEPESTFESYPMLSRTVQGFTCLQSIQLIGAGEASINVLNNIQSSLVSVDIEYLLDQDEEWIGIPSLHQSRSTLCDLTLKYGAVVGFDLVNKCVYSNGTQVALPDSSVRDVHEVIRAFPRLQRLEALGTGRCNTFDELRAFNQARQRELGSWSRLEEYCGPVCTLYELAIACPIASLHLTSDFGDNMMDPAMLMAVLSDAHPLKLSLQAHGYLCEQHPVFLSLFRQNSLRNLGTLVLEEWIATFEGGSEEVDWVKILDSLVDNIIAPLHFLEYFELYLCGDSSHWTGSITAEAKRFLLSSLERQLAVWDAAAFVSRARAANGNSALVLVIKYWDQAAKTTRIVDLSQRGARADKREGPYHVTAPGAFREAR
ncbi:hypothetical protein BN946_scf184643.g2 [Trametes cinnabarina]|uniref:F-box domain-containing protein n=1 Tax=Pycnoporus cinnabarinus TaxID=5643 RepID=A0A060SIE6_PYCCI|nr:hypothetical protein BN946_scf184643.g2 [Trametes cinnabarina]